LRAAPLETAGLFCGNKMAVRCQHRHRWRAAKRQFMIGLNQDRVKVGSQEMSLVRLCFFLSADIFYGIRVAILLAWPENFILQEAFAA
jgi:hypothetical protein